jgi:hypothetical protein
MAGPHGLVEERHVLDRLLVGTPLGVDPAAAAEDGHRSQVGLAVHPLRPKPAVRLEAAEPDVGNGRQAGPAQLAVKKEGDRFRDQ